MSAESEPAPQSLELLQQEYRIALYKAGVAAAKSLESIFSTTRPSASQLSPVEAAKVEAAIKLLAVVEGVPLSSGAADNSKKV